MNVTDLYKGRFLALKQRGTWEYVARTVGDGVIAIIATTPDRELLLVEQYRPPVDAQVIELPAGLIGDSPEHAQEDMLTAGQRELIEETGYRAGHMEYLMDFPSSAGLTSETVYLAMASDLQRVGPGGGDSSENITVHSVAVVTVVDWLRDQRSAGKLVDPKIYSALYWLENGV